MLALTLQLNLMPACAALDANNVKACLHAWACKCLLLLVCVRVIPFAHSHTLESVCNTMFAYVWA